MEAGLGNNPSYVWQSLLAARERIREGLIWQVGDGRTIEVSTHKWLSHKPMFIGEPRPNLMVSELIDENSRQWNREKLFDLFAYRTRMEIMAIPLAWVSGRDKLNWKENKGKVFSIKSVYQVALRLKQQDCVEHSTAARDRPIWNKIWSLKVLKLRTFYCVPALTFCQPEIIYIGGSCMWSQGVVSAVRTQKQQSMCNGPALLPRTYGHYVGGSSKNAPMQPLISSLYFG